MQFSTVLSSTFQVAWLTHFAIIKYIPFRGAAVAKLLPSSLRSRLSQRQRYNVLSMLLCDIFLRLGEDTFQQLVRSISIGRLKTYQLFDRLKTRLHMQKLS